MCTVLVSVSRYYIRLSAVLHSTWRYYKRLSNLPNIRSDLYGDLQTTICYDLLSLAILQPTMLCDLLSLLILHPTIQSTDYLLSSVLGYYKQLSAVLCCALLYSTLFCLAILQPTICGALLYMAMLQVTIQSTDYPL
jgi:hypothetical protein